MKLIVFPLTGLLAGCGDKVIAPASLPSVGARSVPARVSRQGERSKPHVDSVKTGSNPTQSRIAAEEPVIGQHVAEGAIAALAAVNACLDPLIPAMKRRLAETADVSEPRSIQAWVVAQCGAQLDAVRASRSAVLDAETGLEIVQILSLVDSDIRAVGEALALAKSDFAIRYSGRFYGPPIWTDATAQADLIAAAVADARGRQGFWLVEEEYVRWQNDPRELNLRDSEAAPYIRMGEAIIESLRICLDRIEACAVANITGAFVFHDRFVEDPEIACAAEMEWSQPPLLVHAGVVRAQPVIAQRDAVVLRIDGLAELKQGGQRLAQARTAFVLDVAALIDRTDSSTELAELVPAPLLLPGAFPPALRPEVERWQADPMQPVPRSDGAVLARASAQLQSLSECSADRFRAVRVFLASQFTQEQIGEFLAEQAAACYSPLMTAARIAVTHPATFPGPLYRGLKNMTRWLIVQPRDLALAILAIRADPGELSIEEHAVRLRAMPAGVTFVTPDVVASLTRPVV